MPPSVQHRYSPVVSRPRTTRLPLHVERLYRGGFTRFEWKKFVTTHPGIRGSPLFEVPYRMRNEPLSGTICM
jgi:hypothetical protein